MDQADFDDAIDAVVRAIDRLEQTTRADATAPPAAQVAVPAPETGSAPTPAPAAAPESDDAFYELVGRLVAKTHTLDGHLGAAAELRAEITGLVARLAATDPR